jgi:hypothetical protein
MIEDAIGIDGSKDGLDAHRLSSGEISRVTDDAGGHAALIRWIGAAPVARVVL